MAEKKNFDLSWIVPNAKVWVEVPENEKSNEVYRMAIVETLDATKTKVKVKYLDSKPSEEIKLASVLERADDKKTSVDDMVDLECLNDAELLINLKKRFENKEIFTYVGPSMLVTNPYELIPELFTPSMLEKYHKYIFQPQLELKELKPHVWGIAAEAYKSLFEMEKNQALVISGESGAGKTENAKYAMKFLTGLGKLEKRKSSVRGSVILDLQKQSAEAKKEVGIEDKILSCNPILESFGNSKTVRNDNSSRFGKYVRLLVNKKSRIVLGAKMDSYLLEKSRITFQGKGERNYHIFYHLFKGASIEELSLIDLAKDNKKLEMSSFEYLNKSDCYEVANIKDDLLYKEVTDSFKAMRFTPEEENAIWCIVSSVLHIGNIQIDESTFDNDNPCNLKNVSHLKTVAKLLKIDYEILEKSLLFKTRDFGKQVIESPMQKLDCEFARDTLSKDLFERLFGWLVKKLNFIIMPQEDLANFKNIDFEQLESTRFAIGLLDIFGFEVLKINSLEQICINYTNEKLQQLYISYVFKAEEKVFINEGLEKFIVDLNFKDNQAVIDLLDLYPLGIYHLLDENCAIAGSDDNLIQKIKSTHKNHKNFITPKLSNNSFIIVHTAKNVEYHITGFRIKNKDEMSKLMLTTLQSSKFIEFVKIFKGIAFGENEEIVKENANTQKKASDKFLGAKFRLQMKDLMNELTSCDCHFIRCIKPNEQKQKGLWVPLLALTQIRYLGVLDSIKVRRDSFPLRKSYKLFYQKYGELENNKFSIPKLIEMNADFRALIIGMFKQYFPELGTDLVLFGKTKILMRSPAINIIEGGYKEKMKQKNILARKIQRAYYRYQKRKQLRKILNGIRKIQSQWHCYMEHKKLKLKLQKIRKIQAFLHKKFLKLQAKNYRKFCMKLQKYFRRYKNVKTYLLSKKSIIIIQKLIRGFLCRVKVRKIRMCREMVLKSLIFPAFNYVINIHAIKIQKLARGYLTKCKYFKIVLQARRVKKQLMEVKAIKKIQKIGRGYIIRQRMNRLKRAAFYIQGYFRMKWLSSLVKRLRKAALIIQRNVRIFVNRKRAINERINSFLEGHTDDYQDLVLKEKRFLYKEDKKNDNSTNEKLFGLNNVREIAPYDKKIQLFTYIFDIDFMVDTSEIYDPYWGSLYKNTLKEISNSESDLQWLQIGSTHTIGISSNPHRIYSWGWNDNFQLGRETAHPIKKTSQNQVHLPYSGLKIRTASCGEDHNYLLDYDNNLWCWGGNTKGQLGLGHRKNIEYPNRVELISKNMKIKEIKSKYYSNCLITECGKAFSWPRIKSDGSYCLKPIELFFPLKTSIVSVSCGFNFNCFLTNNGLLYTMGYNNENGQLGLGDMEPKNEPTLIESLRNSGEKIVTMECGFGHVIAKNSLGKVFSWGWGGKGQLGHGRFVNELSPRIVNFNSMVKNKVLQVMAGYKCSLVLMENKKILWWGTNGTISSINTPKEMKLSTKNGLLNNSDFNPVRILASWSKNISLLYVTIADTRAGNFSQAVKHKILNTLHYKWEESSLSEIDPPFVESISNYFSVKNMKLKRTVSAIKIQPKYPQNFLMNTPNSIEQPEILSENEFPTPVESSEKIFYRESPENNKDKMFESKDLYQSPDFVRRDPKIQKITMLKNDPSPIKEFKIITEEKESMKLIQKIPYTKDIKKNELQDKNFRNSVKEGGILKIKEDNSNISNVNKEKNRSNSRVSFVFAENTEKKPLDEKKSNINFLTSINENIENDVTKNKLETKENKISETNIINEEMEKKLITIKSKYKSIMVKKKEEWTDLDWQFYKIANEPKMQNLLSQIK